MFPDLVRQNRSYRRFDQQERISLGTLRELVELARLTPSAANKQPLKYILVSDEEVCEKVFSCLAWAGYLKDWAGPSEGEKPSAYVVILSDLNLSSKCGTDVGIAGQTITLGAVTYGYGGCMIGSIKQHELRQILNIPENLETKLVIALGKPAETIKLETVGADGNIRYWRGDDQVHYVPKRKLEDLVIGEF